MLGALLDILFPPLCHLCKEFIPDAGALHLCAGCRNSLRPVPSPQCTICGIPFATEGGIDHPCGPCSTETRHFVSARAAAIHDGSVRELIHRFKYNGNVRLVRPLAQIAAQALTPFVDQTRPNLLIPVPLHRKRLRERGFNQAVLLGARLAKSWKLPISNRNLQRIRWTEPQISLSGDLRRKNVRGAFAVTDRTEIEGKRILLLDDVYTTGSTVLECARTLTAAGAHSVHVITVARATS